MSREEAKRYIGELKMYAKSQGWDEEYQIACDVAMNELEQEPILDKINKMKFEIADTLEFWDYSPNNNPLARDMLETITNFWGDIKAESEEEE